MTINETLLILKNNSFSNDEFAGFIVDSMELLNKKEACVFIDELKKSNSFQKLKMNPYILNLIVNKYPLHLEQPIHHRRFKIDKWCEPNKYKSYCCSIMSTYGQFVFACRFNNSHVFRWTVSPRSHLYNLGINVIDADHFIKLEDMVVLDVETTSLNPLTGDVIEVALYEPSSGNKLSRLLPLRKSKNVPEDIMSLTGITNEMLKDLPPITSDDLDKLIDEFDLSNKPILIWSGINMFDAHFLASLFIQTGNNKFKELKFVSAMDIIKKYSNYEFASLSKDYLANYLDINTDGSHRALNDCIIEADIYKYLFEKRK